jgi:hypothetical protein
MSIMRLVQHLVPIVDSPRPVHVGVILPVRPATGFDMAGIMVTLRGMYGPDVVIDDVGYRIYDLTGPDEDVIDLTGLDTVVDPEVEIIDVVDMSQEVIEID